MTQGGVATAGMRELEAQVKTCQLCRLAKTRTNAVPGEGNPHAEVMFIGEGPGYHEDKQGRPFVGQAGTFLNELLGIAGLDRSSVYIANVVKCRPPNNRDPMPDEMAACAPYLERQIALIKPKVIVTLGRFSMSRFFPGERISQIHGTARIVDGVLCVAMYHPAAGLHQASLADIIRADFRKLPIYIEQARLMSAPPPEVAEENVVEAQALREGVIHEPETAEVLPVDELSPEGRTNGAVQSLKTMDAPAAGPDTPGDQAILRETPEPLQPGKRGTHRKKPEKKQEDYEQLTFF
jgi:DNA polymerase